MLGRRDIVDLIADVSQNVHIAVSLCCHSLSNFFNLQYLWYDMRSDGIYSLLNIICNEGESPPLFHVVIESSLYGKFVMVLIRADFECNMM